MTQYLTATEYRSFGLAPAALASYSDAQIDPFLQNASQWADGYLRSEYYLPLTSWGQDLKQAVAYYATWALLMHRGFDPADSMGLHAQQSLQQAEKFWADVSNGRRALEVVGTTGPARGGARVWSSAPRGW